MPIRNNLVRFYKMMERRILPGLQYSQHRYEELLGTRVKAGVDWLDIGCGRRMLPLDREPQERELASRANSLVGIDLDVGSLKENSVVGQRVFGSISALPFQNERFDLVTANMVVEHLADPAASFGEVARVLRSGGLFIFHTPNTKGFPTSLARRVPEVAKAPLARWLDGRVAADVFPTFYRCNTVSDVNRSAHAAGLTVDEILLLSSTAMFSVVPPLALFELLWYRHIRTEDRREARSNLMAVLAKPGGAPA
jgi:ubiquinone/menaquinone biosynthesis C-methylase UbiE